MNRKLAGGSWERSKKEIYSGKFLCLGIWKGIGIQTRSKKLIWIPITVSKPKFPDTVFSIFFSRNSQDLLSFSSVFRWEFLKRRGVWDRQQANELDFWILPSCLTARLAWWLTGSWWNRQEMRIMPTTGIHRHSQGKILRNGWRSGCLFYVYFPLFASSAGIIS